MTIMTAAYFDSIKDYYILTLINSLIIIGMEIELSYLHFMAADAEIKMELENL